MQTTVLALALIAPGADPDFAAFDARVKDLEARVAALEGKAAPAPKAVPSACPGGCPLGAGGCGSKTCPGVGWNGPCPCSAKAAGDLDTSTYGERVHYSRESLKAADDPAYKIRPYVRPANESYGPPRAPVAGATYPQYLVGGRWVGEAEFRKAYPAAASGVAAPAPFTLSPCGPAGCPSTLTTPAIGAGPLSSSSSGFYRLDGTSTPAGAVIPGSTSGCASGNCPAPSRYAPARGLFRR